MDKSSTLSTIVGLDLGHKSWVACRYSPDDKHLISKGGLTPKSIHKLFSFLSTEDTVIIEHGTGSFHLKRTLEKIVGCTVAIFNATRLRIIIDSLKKTDKEDAINLAYLAYTNPERRWPIIEMPTEDNEYLRLISEHAAIVQQRTACKARLYNLCIQSGYRSIYKKDLRTAKNMAEVVKRITGKWQSIARRLAEHAAFLENQLKAIEVECTAALAVRADLSNLYMSMPGIGPIITLAVIAYMDDFKRFTNGGQVSSYVGVVPRVFESSTIKKPGHITKYGNGYLRSLLVQGDGQQCVQPKTIH